MSGNLQKTIKGILIDPENGKIEEVDVPVEKDGSTLHGLYNLIGCSCVDVGRGGLKYLPSHPADDVWFDDEAAFIEDPLGTFQIPGWVPIIGKGVILSFDKHDDSVGHTLTPDDLEVLKKTVILWHRKKEQPDAKMP